MGATTEGMAWDSGGVVGAWEGSWWDRGGWGVASPPGYPCTARALTREWNTGVWCEGLRGIPASWQGCLCRVQTLHPRQGLGLSQAVVQLPLRSVSRQRTESCTKTLCMRLEFESGQVAGMRLHSPVSRGTFSLVGGVEGSGFRV